MRKSDAEIDTIYVSEDGTAARTVDGIGFVYYESEDEAREDTGVERVVYIDELREDWDEDEFEADLYAWDPDDDDF